MIWGSSFILMKAGMQHLSAYQVAAVRMLSAGLISLPFAISGWKKIPRNKIVTILIAGLLGNFLPAFLYCLSEIKIDSSLAAILNAFTPLCTIVIGAAFFQLKTTWNKIFGILTGFIGLALLPFAANSQISFANAGYAGLVLLATICYGTNVHVVTVYLKEISSLQIAAVAFSFFIIPSFIILVYTGFFPLNISGDGIRFSILAALVLGVVGTALATVWFYKLVKSAGSVFASLVTYGIPFIAILWGFIFGEAITALEIICLGIILAGVYMVNR
jgi:drug/metabolite transporter (DMT)-like permease